MSDIQELTQEQMSEVIETRKPIGKFYRQEGNTFVGVDNTTGDAWTEEFNDFGTLLLWINTQMTVEEAKAKVGRRNKDAKRIGIRH